MFTLSLSTAGGLGSPVGGPDGTPGLPSGPGERRGELGGGGDWAGVGAGRAAAPVSLGE